MYSYVDIHSHLNDKRFSSDLPKTLARMLEAGVASIVVGTDKAMSGRAIALAVQHPDLWATIGQHPTDNHTENFDDTWYLEHAKHPRVVAIGECGLDYYWPEVRNRQRSDLKAVSPRSDLGISAITDFEKEKRRQHELFERQMELAAAADKPLMIHGRPTKGTMDAYEDLLHILKNGQKHHGETIRGNIHFFVGNKEIAKQFFDIGFTMSFTGVLTFTHDYDEVVRYISLQSIMTETDAPYVAPVPYRGKRNEPAFVREVVKVIASIREEDEETVRVALFANTCRVFGLSEKVVN